MTVQASYSSSYRSMTSSSTSSASLKLQPSARQQANNSCFSNSGRCAGASARERRACQQGRHSQQPSTLSGSCQYSRHSWLGDKSVVAAVTGEPSEEPKTGLSTTDPFTPPKEDLVQSERLKDSCLAVTAGPVCLHSCTQTHSLSDAPLVHECGAVAGPQNLCAPGAPARHFPPFLDGSPLSPPAAHARIRILVEPLTIRPPVRPISLSFLRAVRPLTPAPR